VGFVVNRSTRSIEMDDDDWTKVDSHGDSLPDYSYPSLSVRLYLAAYEARPLREGDRVKVGKMTGVIEEIEDDRTGVWVDWEDRAAVSWLKVSWLPIEAVTRIEADHE